jgi:hypothetical protein
MSHFTVLVIGDDIEEQLEKFNENLEIEFEDEEPYYRNEYETASRKMKKLPTGELVDPYDTRFINPTPNEYETFKTDSYLFPLNTQDIEVPIKEVYSTFENYVREYHKANYNLGDKLGHMFNPNGKWDWYQVGGRWSGFFKMKPDTEGDAGEPGIMTDFCEEGRADIAKKGDVDFHGMINEHLEEKTEEYKEFHNILGGRQMPKWEEMLKTFDGDEDKTRTAYHNDPAIKDLQDAGFLGIFFSNGYEELMMLPLDEYLKKVAKQSLLTFAVVKDGVWHERGEMGMFAQVSNEKEDEIWLEEFYNLVMSVTDDTTLTLVDCHS